MGLDMYLKCNSRALSTSVNDMDDPWEGGFMAPRGIIAQWRKANAIHNWFVTNVQDGNDDCGTYTVSVDDLVRLHDTIVDVLDASRLVMGTVRNGSKLAPNGEWEPIHEKGMVIEDPSAAKALMPTREGFFFGSQEYDQWYIWDLRYTEAKLSKIIDMLTTADDGRHAVYKEEPDFYVRFEYTSSW